MIATAMFGVGVWAVKLIRDNVADSYSVAEWLAHGSVAFSFAMIVVVGATTLLGGGLVQRTVSFCLLSAVLSLVPAYVCHRDSDWASMAAWMGLHATIVGGSLLVLRNCGCRFMRTSAERQVQPGAAKLGWLQMRSSRTPKGKSKAGPLVQPSNSPS